MATKKKNSAGFTHIATIITIIVGMFMVVGYFTYRQVKINNERQLYSQANKDAQDYIKSISEKYPGKISIDNSCSRTSAKYSEGSLGCSTSTTLEVILNNPSIEKDIINLANAKKTLIPWEQTYHSKGPGPTSPNQKEITIYKLNNKTCSIDFAYKQLGSGANSHELILENGNKILVISAGCSGPAYAEYY